MKPGPAPTPTAILERRGSWRAALRKKEPIIADLIDNSAPEWMKNDDALKAWNELVVVLKNAGVLKRTDWRVLARYCQFWGEWVRLQKSSKKFSLPENERLSAMLLKLERELGLTPSARSALGITNDEKNKHSFFLPESESKQLA